MSEKHSAITEAPKDTRPYDISTKLDLSGLHQTDGGGPTQIFYMMLMQFMLAWGEQSGGGTLADQKIFYRVRTKLEQAVKTNDGMVRLEADEFEFVERCRQNAKLDFKANEAIMRVNRLLDEAVAARNGEQQK